MAKKTAKRTVGNGNNGSAGRRAGGPVAGSPAATRALSRNKVLTISNKSGPNVFVALDGRLEPVRKHWMTVIGKDKQPHRRAEVCGGMARWNAGEHELYDDIVSSVQLFIDDCVLCARVQDLWNNNAKGSAMYKAGSKARAAINHYLLAMPVSYTTSFVGQGRDKRQTAKPDKDIQSEVDQVFGAGALELSEARAREFNDAVAREFGDGGNFVGVPFSLNMKLESGKSKIESVEFFKKFKCKVPPDAAALSLIDYLDNEPNQERLDDCLSAWDAALKAGHTGADD